MLFCTVAAVQAGIYLVQHLRHFGLSARVVLYTCIVIAGVYGTVYFMRRAVALHKEATASRIQPPTVDPDFSTLSDGSQRWKNFDEIQ